MVTEEILHFKRGVRSIGLGYEILHGMPQTRSSAVKRYGIGKSTIVNFYDIPILFLRTVSDISNMRKIDPGNYQ
jgi:hypothetical protein